eukprot:14582-Heterococcus_DN1.PRE.2
MVRLGGLPGNDAADDESNVFVVFGGMSWQNSNGICNLFSPFGSKPAIDEPAAAQPLKVVYHNSTHVLKVSTSTWHKPHITGHTPSARYGHVAVALSRDTMWVHGGRCADGTYSRDSYLLHITSLQWECVSTPLLHKTAAYAHAALTAASPSARMYSSAVHVPRSNRVVLCGGVNNVTGACYSDVWFWNTVTHEWTEQIVTGVPPTARFGHSMLLCGAQGRVLVLGGCCVSAVQEIARPKDWDKTELQLRLAAEEVHRAYELEDAEVAVGGAALLSQARAKPVKVTPDTLHTATAQWRESSQRQARLAAAIAAREHRTDQLEQQLQQLIKDRATALYWSQLQDKHPYSSLDVHWLDTEMLVWEPAAVQIVSSTSSSGSSAVPCARMHFAAAVVAGGTRVAVWGGFKCCPSQSLPVDNNVHILELGSSSSSISSSSTMSNSTLYSSSGCSKTVSGGRPKLKWTVPVAADTTQEVKIELDAAAAQLRRAQRALLSAKSRALSAGVADGRTLEVAEAEAVAAVGVWRLRTLIKQLYYTPAPPANCGALAAASIGQRVFLFGGLRGAKTTSKAAFILDLEQPEERCRRRVDEFHQLLERQRVLRVAAESDELRRAAKAEAIREREEKAREVHELQLMAVEDAHSSQWELTVAPVPYLTGATATALWIAWDRPLLMCNGTSIPTATSASSATAASNSDSNSDDSDTGSVQLEYALYMRGGWREWKTGDAVRVQYAPKLTQSLDVKVKSSSNRFTAAPHLALPPTTTTATTAKAVTVHTSVDADADDEQSVHTITSSEATIEAAAANSCSSSGNDTLNLKRATIISVQASGAFDVQYSNSGVIERSVARWRLHSDGAQPWSIVYFGTDQSYVVHSMAPQLALDREAARGRAALQVAAEFALQVRGCEWPVQQLRWSRHSAVTVLHTAPVVSATAAPPAAVSATKRKLLVARSIDDAIVSATAADYR